MYKNNGKVDCVRCMKGMAGIQWERHALHIWQEELREQWVCCVMSHTGAQALEGISVRGGWSAP